MRINNLLPTVVFATLSISTLQAASSAEALFQEKCSMCHMTTRPADRSALIAPPVMGVMRHVKMAYPDKERAVDFITSYVLDPQKPKAVCLPQSIARFGLMPSQKGAVSEEELQQIAVWMYDNYPLGNRPNVQP